MSDATPAPSGRLDEVMLAMDVVDTLRHRQYVVDKELNAEGREAALIARLREIYTAQGIEVPDRILREGVKALEEKRFVYEPPKSSLRVWLAKKYVTREQWLKPTMAVVLASIASVSLYQISVAGPKRVRIEAAQIELEQTLPADLEKLRNKIISETQEERVRAMAEAHYADGMSAIAAADITRARSAKGALSQLGSDLAAEYDVTIISRPGEMSGIFRIPDDVQNTRNYYLIVEAIDARGRTLSVRVQSEEDQSAQRAEKWGQRVSENVFNQVAADKQDDQIIQGAVIGHKSVGRLTPNYTIEVMDGKILQW